MTESRPSSLNHFSVFSFTDDYWTLDAQARGRFVAEWSAAVGAAATAFHVYQTYPLEPSNDFILWSCIEASTTDAPAWFFDAFARATTPHRRYLRLRHALWGFTRPSQYSKSRSTHEIDPFDADRRPYLVVYPFTKTPEWYLKNQETRQGMMNEHIRIGKQYRDINQLLLYSFGLQDHEFVVVYEMDDLVRFSQLVMELRGTEGRVYTKSDNPVHTGIYRSPDQSFAAWIG
jgi:chlorite dismutase